MTKLEVQETIKRYNNMIADFRTQELPKILKERYNIEVVDGKISLEHWFKVNQIIAEQNFYCLGKAIQEVLRDEGFDVKMNMQDDTLVLYENGMACYNDN